MVRAFETNKAVVNRLVDDGNKTDRTEEVGTIRGFLKPASIEVLAINSLQSGTGFSFFSKRAIDVQVTDTLTINSVVYYVKGVNVEPTTAGYYEITLQKPVKS